MSDFGETCEISLSADIRKGSGHEWIKYDLKNKTKLELLCSPAVHHFFGAHDVQSSGFSLSRGLWVPQVQEACPSHLPSAY